MVGANARGHIPVQIKAADQRRMAINMPILECFELCHDARIKVQHAGIVHHFRQPDDLGMVAERQQVFDLKPRTGGFKGGGRNAG